MYKEYVVYKTYLLIDTSQMSMYVILTGDYLSSAIMDC